MTHRLIGVAALSIGLLTSAASAQAACDYAGQAYSVGATVCECPGIKAENLNWQREQGQITSRRLVCSPGGTWDDAKTMCVDISLNTTTAETYNRLVEQYCPRLPVNYAELQKAIAEETMKYIDAAPKGAIVSTVETICKRYRIEAPCKSVLDAINGPSVQHQ